MPSEMQSTTIFEFVREKGQAAHTGCEAGVRGLIEAARAAIVGLIRTFGEALKGTRLNSSCGVPETAERARRWIDGTVESAVETVNQAAEVLKTAADKALDWLGEQLDEATREAAGCLRFDSFGHCDDLSICF